MFQKQILKQRLGIGIASEFFSNRNVGTYNEVEFLDHWIGDGVVEQTCRWMKSNAKQRWRTPFCDALLHVVVDTAECLVRQESCHYLGLEFLVQQRQTFQLTNAN